MANINNRDLIRKIQERNPNYMVKDLNIILDSLEDTILNELRDGNVVKVGKLIKFIPTYIEPQNHWDGIHHKHVDVPGHTVVKVKALKELKDLDI